MLNQSDEARARIKNQSLAHDGFKDLYSTEDEAILSRKCKAGNETSQGNPNRVTTVNEEQLDSIEDNGLFNLKLHKVIELKEDLEQIYGNGILEQMVGVDTIKMVSLLSSMGFYRRLQQWKAYPTGDTVFTDRENGKEERKKSFAEVVANTKNNNINL